MRKRSVVFVLVSFLLGSALSAAPAAFATKLSATCAQFAHGYSVQCLTDLAVFQPASFNKDINILIVPASFVNEIGPDRALAFLYGDFGGNLHQLFSFAMSKNNNHIVLLKGDDDTANTKLDALGLVLSNNENPKKSEICPHIHCITEAEESTVVGKIAENFPLQKVCIGSSAAAGHAALPFRGSVAFKLAGEFVGKPLEYSRALIKRVGRLQKAKPRRSVKAVVADEVEVGAAGAGLGVGDALISMAEKFDVQCDDPEVLLQRARAEIMLMWDFMCKEFPLIFTPDTRPEFFLYDAEQLKIYSPLEAFFKGLASDGKCVPGIPKVVIYDVKDPLNLCRLNSQFKQTHSGLKFMSLQCLSGEHMRSSVGDFYDACTTLIKNKVKTGELSKSDGTQKIKKFERDFKIQSTPNDLDQRKILLQRRIDTEWERLKNIYPLLQDAQKPQLIEYEDYVAWCRDGSIIERKRLWKERCIPMDVYPFPAIPPVYILKRTKFKPSLYSVEVEVEDKDAEAVNNICDRKFHAIGLVYDNFKHDYLRFMECRSSWNFSCEEYFAKKNAEPRAAGVSGGVLLGARALEQPGVARDGAAVPLAVPSSNVWYSSNLQDMHRELKALSPRGVELVNILKWRLPEPFSEVKARWNHFFEARFWHPFIRRFPQSVDLKYKPQFITFQEFVDCFKDRSPDAITAAFSKLIAGAGEGTWLVGVLIPREGLFREYQNIVDRRYSEVPRGLKFISMRCYEDAHLVHDFGYIVTPLQGVWQKLQVPRQAFSAVGLSGPVPREDASALIAGLPGPLASAAGVHAMQSLPVAGGSVKRPAVSQVERSAVVGQEKESFDCGEGIDSRKKLCLGGGCSGGSVIIKSEVVIKPEVGPFVAGVSLLHRRVFGDAFVDSVKFDEWLGVMTGAMNAKDIAIHCWNPLQNPSDVASLIDGTSKALVVLRYSEWFSGQDDILSKIMDSTGGGVALAFKSACCKFVIVNDLDRSLNSDERQKVTTFFGEIGVHGIMCMLFNDMDIRDLHALEVNFS